MVSQVTHGSSTGKKHDWGLFFGGILVAICGIVAIAWPGATLGFLAIMAGIAFLISGFFNFATWLRTHKYVDGSGWTLANAIFNVILGIMFLVHPLIAAGVITILVGCFTIAYSAFAIVSAISVRKTIKNWWVMLLNGIISLICGCFFIFSPASFAIFLGVFLIMQGVTMTVYGATPSNNVR